MARPGVSPTYPVPAHWHFVAICETSLWCFPPLSSNRAIDTPARLATGLCKHPALRVALLRMQTGGGPARAGRGDREPPEEYACTPATGGQNDDRRHDPGARRPTERTAVAAQTVSA